MIKINEHFFKIFKERWLKSKEVFYFLHSIPKLLEENFIKLSFFPKLKPESKCYCYNLGGDFFVFPSKSTNWRCDSINWKKRHNSKNIKESNLNLKIDGKPVIFYWKSEVYCTYVSCELDSENQIKRRSYKLLDQGDFILIHYLVDKDNENNENSISLFSNNIQRNKEKIVKSEALDIFNCLYKNPIKLIDFAPETVHEFTETKIILILESDYTYDNLKSLENKIKVKLSNTFIDCKVNSVSSISFITPPLQSQETIIDLYINGYKVIDGQTNNMTIKVHRINGNSRNLLSKIFTLTGSLLLT